MSIPTHSGDGGPKLYTAGAMSWTDGEDSWWKRSTDDLPAGVEYYHPDEGFFDHGGDFVDGAVSEDMQMIREADGLVAYFSETPQIGTTVEVMHALSLGKPTLVLFTPDLVEKPGSRGPRPPSPATISEDAPDDVPPDVPLDAPTDATADDVDADPTVALGRVTMRLEAEDHWFLINYIAGDAPDATQRSVPDDVDAWPGVEHGTVGVVEPDEVGARVERWLTGAFGGVGGEE